MSFLEFVKRPLPCCQLTLRSSETGDYCIMNSPSSASYLHRNWDYKYNLVVCTYPQSPNLHWHPPSSTVFTETSCMADVEREGNDKEASPHDCLHCYVILTTNTATSSSQLTQRRQSCCRKQPWHCCNFFGKRCDAICSSQERKRRVVPAMIRTQRLPELHTGLCLFSCTVT